MYWQQQGLGKFKQGCSVHYFWASLLFFRSNLGNEFSEQKYLGRIMKIIKKCCFLHGKCKKVILLLSLKIFLQKNFSCGD